MLARMRLMVLALMVAIAVSDSAQGVMVNVPVESSNSAAWARSDGGTGTTMVSGGPAVWNSTFEVSIPPGSSAISFTLDSFSADDKGVVELNGTIIGDAVIFQPNGGAAGAGTFDFGLGGGNQAYTFVGFTPGASFPLPDGTTTFTLIVYMNDTGTSDPMAPPLSQTNISGFGLSGDLNFDAPATSTPTPSATATATSSPMATATPSSTPTSTSTPSITATPSATPTRTDTPTLTASEDGAAPAIPTLSGAGGALLALLLAGVAILVLTRSRV